MAIEGTQTPAEEVKCTFAKNSVEYLGYLMDEDELHTLLSKVEAIVSAPEPCNVQQLRSFLGLLNYCPKSNLATILHPLNDLLKKMVKWKWTPECANAFKRANKELVSSRVLAHFDPTRLAADTSAYGVGSSEKNYKHSWNGGIGIGL